MKKLKKFLSEVSKEMSKVHWPTKKDMITYSGATIAFILMLSLFFLLSDIIIAAIKVLVH